MRRGLIRFRELTLPGPRPRPDPKQPCPACGQGQVMAKVNSDYDGLFCINLGCRLCDAPGKYIRRTEENAYLNFAY